jgi:hypothetical protein
MKWYQRGGCIYPHVSPDTINHMFIKFGTKGPHLKLSDEFTFGSYWSIISPILQKIKLHKLKIIGMTKYRSH